MNLLALQSSPRANGNTSRLMDLAVDTLRRQLTTAGEVLQVETVHLARREVKTCLGCRACFDRGETHCPLRDDVAALRERMDWADALIVASPVYVESVNGILKNWIDRMAYGCHRPFLNGKPALVLTTSGGGATGSAARTAAMALMPWGGRISARRNFRMGGARMDEGEVRRRFAAPLGSMVAALRRDVRRQKQGRPAWLSVLFFTIQQRAYRRMAQTTPCVDTDYWQQKGWLDRRCVYYVQVHRSLKTATARLAGRALSLFFL